MGGWHQAVPPASFVSPTALSFEAPLSNGLAAQCGRVAQW